MSIFSAKGYVFLASVARDILHETPETIGREFPHETDRLIARRAAAIAVEILAAALKSENSNFDMGRFHRAIYGPFDNNNNNSQAA